MSNPKLDWENNFYLDSQGDLWGSSWGKTHEDKIFFCIRPNEDHIFSSKISPYGAGWFRTNYAIPKDLLFTAIHYIKDLEHESQ